MSLEQALAENTAALNTQTHAIKELLGAWNALRTQSGAKVQQSVRPTLAVVNVEAATEAPTEAATEAPTEAATEAPTEVATEAPTEVATEAVNEVQPVATKSDLEAAVRKYAPTHRDAVVGTFADFGVSRASELTEEQYAPYIAALLKKVGA